MERYGAAARHERLNDRPVRDPSSPRRPRLAPRSTELLMCLPAGSPPGPGITRAAALRLLRNGVIPLQGVAALTELDRRATNRPPRACQGCGEVIIFGQDG